MKKSKPYAAPHYVLSVIDQKLGVERCEQVAKGKVCLLPSGYLNLVTFSASAGLSYSIASLDKSKPDINEEKRSASKNNDILAATILSEFTRSRRLEQETQFTHVNPVDSFDKPKGSRKSRTSDSLGRSRMVAVFGMRRRRGRFGGRSFARFAAQSHGHRDERYKATCCYESSSGYEPRRLYSSPGL